MGPRLTRLRSLAAAVTACALVALDGTIATLQAQSAENVAVVINENSEESKRVGEFYAVTRGLPPSNILRIHTSTQDTIERPAYDASIERPIAVSIRRGGLQDRLLYLVLTKGVPLRIAGTTGLAGTLASVDSELTLLYRRLTGQQLSASGRVDNPFFLGTRPIGDARRFTHRDHDIYLVTRLDAYTVQQALGLVTRAQAPRPEGQIVLDQRGATTDRTGDDWFELAAQRLAAQGHKDRVVLESTARPARPVGPVLGYASWGSTDPANQVRSTSMAFAPGSIAANLASFDARTFREPPETWRPVAATGTTPVPFEGSTESLIGDLIREGVTGAAGQVAEPYLVGAVRPEILFPAYVAGFNLAEAFYLATPALSWQTVIVGDPLLAPFSRPALSRAEIEGDVHAGTGLPGFFAMRRIAESSALLRGVPERAIELSLQAETRLDRDDRAGARRALEEAVRLAPQVSDWLLLLAGLEDQDREYESAIRRYEQVVAMQPEQPIALNNLAYALATHRKAPAEALPFARRAVALAPRSPVVLDTLAWIEYLTGNSAVATMLFEDAIQLGPAIAEIRLHAAEAFAANGMPERAQSELAEALRLKPALAEEVRQVRARIALKDPPPR
jgi:uncharacterized protein (TIGR03790 family)